MRAVLLRLIRGYQTAISPMLGVACRYEPSCSQYAYEAIERHGARRGMMLAARRLARCRPGGGEGYDPVPPATHAPNTDVSDALPSTSPAISSRTGESTKSAAFPTIDTSTH